MFDYLLKKPCNNKEFTSLTKKASSLPIEEKDYTEQFKKRIHTEPLIILVDQQSQKQNEFIKVSDT